MLVGGLDLEVVLLRDPSGECLNFFDQRRHALVGEA